MNLIHHHLAEAVEQVALVSKTLSEIRTEKELWKIKARVTRVWNAILLDSGEQLSLDMILIDQQG